MTTKLRSYPQPGRNVQVQVMRTSRWALRWSKAALDVASARIIVTDRTDVTR